MSDSLPFGLFDILVVVWLVAEGFGGHRRGLSGELARIACLLAALAAGVFWYEAAGDHLLTRARLPETNAYIVGFAIVVIVAYLALWVIRAIVRHLLDLNFKGKLEQVGGITVALLRTVFAVSLLVLVVQHLGSEKIRIIVSENSATGRMMTERIMPYYQDLLDRHTKKWTLPLPADQESGDLPL